MITFIDQVALTNKRILLRVDYNVSFKKDGSIRDETRIVQSLPTINHLLSGNNKLIIATHLGRPKGNDPTLSLEKVARRLNEHLAGYKVVFVSDFLKDRTSIQNQQQNEIIFLENLRFYKEEQENNPDFAKSLANLTDTYVNDAFSVDHRPDASITGVPEFLPSYGGLLLKKELEAMQKILNKPEVPFIAILAGTKISTKLKLIEKLLPITSRLLLAGGLANTLFLAKGIAIGKSIAEPNMIEQAKQILESSKDKILLPVDAIVGTSLDGTIFITKPVDGITEDEMILDIGPETRSLYAKEIQKAHTLVWNGPVGYFENPLYKAGSDEICKAITGNDHIIAVIGGGETLAAIAGNPNLDKIYHISTGGGAMLEYIENGTLPGVEVLNNQTA